MLELKLDQLTDKIRRTPLMPQQLFYQGADLLELLKLPRVAIVGTRKPTHYGRRITDDFASNLAAQGVVIISGLAYGIDAIAHEAALEAGGKCIAVLPGPLDNIVPAAHEGLARRILANGGTLVSELPPGTPTFKQYFVARNRIVSGLSQGILITEATAQSGTRHTVRFAGEQSLPIMAVPGDIYRASHVGTNRFIKNLKAQPVTSYKDVLKELKLHAHETPLKKIKGSNKNEQTILNLMLQGLSDGDKLLEASRLEVPKFNQSLAMLEINGKIYPLCANHWAIS